MENQSQCYKASVHHLPYGIIQCYQPRNTGECAPPQPQPDRPVMDLHTPEGSQAELTLVLVIYQNKCTKDNFIHLLTATFKNSHIEKSKNFKR